MAIRVHKFSDEKLFRLGLRFTGGLMAVAIPVCLATLTMVGPVQRVYIAVLSSLLLMMVAALVGGLTREVLRAGRHVQVLVRAYRRRRAMLDAAADAEPLPA